MTARQYRLALQRENRLWPEVLTKVGRDKWIDDGILNRITVFRSSRFLVQVFEERGGIIRLSINRTTAAKGGEAWADGITWEDLQKIKAQCGYGDRYAIEVYPCENDLVNVANMRHLWVLPEPLAIGWFKPVPVCA